MNVTEDCTVKDLAIKINLKPLVKGVCRVCGCTFNNACTNPTHGNCWWIDTDETLCSHCAIEEIRNDPNTIQPIK